MRSIEEWYNVLIEITQNTEYDVIIKKNISSPVVAIVPKWQESPQRIAVYPKKTKNPGLVLEEDIYSISKIQTILGEPNRIHSNRPHFTDVSDDIIIAICKIFLMKD